MSITNLAFKTEEPIAAAPSDAATAGAAPVAQSEQKARILVADDVADNRDILVRRLQRRGFEAVEATGGRDTLEKLATQSFDIVLLDIMMPDLSGNDVLRTIREKHSDVELPVIMVSAKSQSEDVVESLNLGANDYVTKPIDFSVAIARIGTQLARKRAADAERAELQTLASETQRLHAAIATETTSRKHSEDQLHFLAYHDPLTGLLNRTAFRDILNEALDNVAVTDVEPALLFIDLDRFKIVNDMHGHGVGDSLLAAVAQRLQQTISPGIRLARLGGDEFGAIILDGPQPATAMREAESVVAALAEPFMVNGQIFQIGASCGVARASSCEESLDKLIKAADLAMYHAKSSGRSGVVLFEPRMLEEQEEKRALEADLRIAVQQGDFQVFYQPLVNAKTGAVKSFEALLRWPHPSRGMIAPETFIPLAEETGLIINIGEWVLRRACEEAATWPSDVGVAVNLSPLQFRSPSLLNMVVSSLASSGLDPKRLELEITETALLGAEARNHEILRSLRTLGVRVSIDDFGTGYSSMSYLQNFAVDKIKIDRRFVQGLDNDAGSAAIIQAIIALGFNIGVSTTAEGIETEEQLTSIMKHGCTEVQGYLFSRPLKAEDARTFIRDRMGEAISTSHAEKERSSIMSGIVRSALARLAAQYMALIEYFIPAKMRADREAANQARMFLISHSMGPILGNAVPLAVLLFNPTLRVDALVMVVSITAFWVFPFLLKWGLKYEALVLTSVVNLNFCILWSCYFYGGVSSPTLPWLLIIPILSLFYIGGEKRLQPALLAISGGAFALFLALYDLIPPPALDMPAYAFQGLGIVSTGAALCYVATMAIYYARIFDAGISLETEVRRRQEKMDALREAVNTADRAGSAKAEFLTRMSHELRTPLNAVIGYSQLLREDAVEAGDTAMKSDIDKIHDAGQYLLRLVNMILDLSKLEAGRMQFDVKKQRLEKLVDMAVSAKRQIVEANRNVVRCDLPAELAEVSVDGGRVVQVLDALVENAAQYTKDGTITISATAVELGDDRQFSIRVTDTGRGIDPAVLPTLFETFTATRDASESRYGGTGLNLTVVHQLCKAMGGTLDVTSELGVGTTFTVTLPREGKKARPAARSAMPQPIAA